MGNPSPIRSSPAPPKVRRHLLIRMQVGECLQHQACNVRAAGKVFEGGDSIGLGDTHIRRWVGNLIHLILEDFDIG